MTSWSSLTDLEKAKSLKSTVGFNFEGKSSGTHRVPSGLGCILFSGGGISKGVY